MIQRLVAGRPQGRSASDGKTGYPSPHEFAWDCDGTAPLGRSGRQRMKLAVPVPAAVVAGGAGARGAASAPGSSSDPEPRAKVEAPDGSDAPAS